MDVQRKSRKLGLNKVQAEGECQTPQNWRGPKEGYVKINIDGALDEITEAACQSGITRNHAGQPLCKVGRKLTVSQPWKQRVWR